MTQKQLGDALGMAQTWISKLENPDYGKVTVATLLRLAEAFDTDLEIKFRPFSTTLDELSRQGPEYFSVRSFDEEEAEIAATLSDKRRQHHTGTHNHVPSICPGQMKITSRASVTNTYGPAGRMVITIHLALPDMVH